MNNSIRLKSEFPEKIGKWYKVENSYLLSEGVVKDSFAIYEYDKCVSIGQFTCIMPVLVVYKAVGGYGVCLRIPRGSSKILRMRGFTKVFDSLEEAREYAIKYMTEHQ